MDQTGKLPFTSNRVNNYIFVLYYYVSNNIIVRPMKVRNYKDVICVFNNLHENLLTSGLKPAYIRL